MKKKLNSLLSIFLSLVIVFISCIVFTPKASAANRQTVLHVWFSDSPMGNCPEYAINGYGYYLCYKLYDENSGRYYDSYSSGNYKVTMTFYRPNGSVAFTYDYNNDNNWIRHTFNNTGTYRGVVTLSGSISGTCGVSIKSRNAHLIIDGWTSKTAMGKDRTIYFNNGDNCYYCYKIYDKNTGTTIDRLLPGRNYTVTQGFYDKNGNKIGSVDYNNDNNWIRANSLEARTKYIARLELKGDFEAKSSEVIFTNYYTSGEIYNFNNSPTDFFGSSTATGKYDLQTREYNTLVSKIKSNYFWTANNKISQLKAEMDSSWGGSCYGMSVTTMLDKFNQIGMNENFGTSNYGYTSSINKISRPFTNRAARSAINYYQISQSVGFDLSYQSYKSGSSNWSTGLKNLVNTVNSNNLVLFNFFWYQASSKSNVGHSIVLQKVYKTNDNSYKIMAYDPNFMDDPTIVLINGNFTSCTIMNDKNNYTYTSSPKSIEFTTNLIDLNKVDIDGSNNNFRSASYSQSTDTSTTFLSFDLLGKVTIYNEEGKYLTYDSSMDCYGTMNVISETHTINGSDSPTTVTLEVDNSESFSFESDNDNLNISVVSKDLFASVDSVNSDGIVIADDGLYVFGNKFDYKTYLTYNSNGDMIKCEGTSYSNDFSMKPNGNGVTVYGDCKNCEISNFVGDEIKSYNVESNCSSFTISCDTNSTDVFFAGSTDDINYDVEIDANENIDVEDISISCSEISVVLGEDYNLYCTVYPNNATHKDLIWGSSNPDIAQVDQNGNVKSVGVGKTIISAMTTDGNVCSECEFTVLAPPVSSVEVDKKVISLEIGESEKIAATVKPDEALNKTVEWKSYDESIAAVSADGTITAHSLGNVTIEVATIDGRYKALVNVNVVPTPVSGILIEENELELYVGEVGSLFANVLPITAANKSIIWSSSDPNVVSVDNNGNIIALNKGIAEITATTQDGNISASCVITVYGYELEDPTTHCSCNCHKSGIIRFVWKLMNFFHKLFGMKEYQYCDCGAKHW